MASEDFQPNFHFSNTLVQHHTLGFLLIIITFSIVFLTLFLYFYYRFICNYTRFSSTTTTTTNLTTPQPPPLAQPLRFDSAAISNLPIFLHQSPAISDMEKGSCGIVRDSECSICLGLFEDEEIIKVLPKCQHAYHSKCVDKWLSAPSSCPLCRAPLKVDQSLHLDL